MKRMDIIKEQLSETSNVIKHGWLNEKIILETKMTCSLFEHIQVVNNRYNEDVTDVVWVDVEGMGYGWRWLDYKDKKHLYHEMMGKLVDDECFHLNREMNNTYYIINEEDGVKNYTFISIFKNKYRSDVVISFSDKELFY